MIPIKLTAMHYSDMQDLLKYIIETTEKDSPQYKAVFPILEVIKINTKSLSRKRRMEILIEDIKKSDLVHQRVKDIGHLL